MHESVTSVPIPVSGQSLELFPVVSELGAGVLVVELGQGAVDRLPGGNLLRGVLDTRNGFTTSCKTDSKYFGNC
jgi:hypothetical protein